MYASLSCRWFVFTYDDPKSISSGILHFNNSIVSIGIFQYQTTTPVNSPNFVCTKYNPLFQGSEFLWFFTAQICVVVGPVIAVVGWMMAMIGVSKQLTATFFFIATGVQASGVVASMSWCDEFFNCPWLLGSMANVASTFLFLLSWLLAICGRIREQTKQEEDQTDDFDSTTAIGGSSQTLESCSMSDGTNEDCDESSIDEESKQSAINVV
jgi:hypothetical protein